MHCTPPIVKQRRRRKRPPVVLEAAEFQDMMNAFTSSMALRHVELAGNDPHASSGDRAPVDESRGGSPCCAGGSAACVSALAGEFPDACDIAQADVEYEAVGVPSAVAVTAQAVAQAPELAEACDPIVPQLYVEAPQSSLCGGDRGRCYAEDVRGERTLAAKQSRPSGLDITTEPKTGKGRGALSYALSCRLDQVLELQDHCTSTEEAQRLQQLTLQAAVGSTAWDQALRRFAHKWDLPMRG